MANSKQTAPRAAVRVELAWTVNRSVYIMIII